MDSKEIERRSRDLHKAIASNEPVSTLLALLEDLRKGVTATEEVLRSTKVGKAVNRLKTHKDPQVARASADLVLKWKKDMKGLEAGAKAKGGEAATAGEGTTPKGKESANGKTEGRAGTKGFKSSVPVEQRSSKTDGIDVKQTGNDIRDACLMLMYDGLANMSEEPPNVVLPIATAIELAAYTNLAPETNPAYKAKMRSLYQNLKNKSNPTLRTRLLSSELSPTRLVTMSLEELKSPERRAEDEAMEKENMDKAMVPKEEKSISTALTCGKCHQKKVSYTQAQTRSADEPMTTFCDCTVCGHRWKFS